MFSREQALVRASFNENDGKGGAIIFEHTRPLLVTIFFRSNFRNNIQNTAKKKGFRIAIKDKKEKKHKPKNRV